jgi:hypothetical protein
MDPPSTHLENDISLLRSTKENLEPLRHDFQSAALLYKKQREKFLRYAQEIKTVKDDILSAAEEPVVPGKETVYRPKNRMETLAPKLDFALRGLEEEANKCSDLEDRMADLLYWISKLEKQFCPVLDNHLQHIRRPDNSPSQRDEAPYKEAAEKVPDQTPPLVQELYSRIGDYRLCVDDLHNFESELRQDLDERDSLRANGYNVIPDMEFFKDRKELRDRMQKELDQAQADITRLKEECSRMGIMFEDDLYIPVLDRSETSFTLTPAHERALESPEPEPTSPKDSIINDFFETRNRVTNWLTGSSTQDETVQPALSKDSGDVVDHDSLSETGWVYTRHPGHPHPHPHPSPATATRIQQSLQDMPVFVGPNPGSSEIKRLLRKSISESIFPAHQVRKIPSGGTVSTM